MSKYYSLFIVFGVFLASSCQHKKAESSVIAAKTDTVITEARLPPLEAGDVFLKNKNPFESIIELKGEHIANDTFIFKPGEPHMIICGNKLITSNLSRQQGDGQVLIFNYPEMVHLKSLAPRGNGADEFAYPSIIPTPDTTLYAYIFESTREQLYKLDKQGNITPDFHFPTSKQGGYWSSKQDIVNLGPEDFIYADDSKTGKSIFRVYKEKDSVITKELLSLQLNPKRKSPFTYIGDFGVNPKKKRMVYAYKYFKILKFIDMETNEVRTLNFQQGDFNDGSLKMADGLDQNVTHYWGMCAQDNYVYCLYSGRTPMEVMRDSGKGKHYIYVEQFDWNGNPVKKYKLDHWGYFSVDEKNKRIIMMSTNDDDPFFFFQLP